ncbi:MAG: hypothetical protein WCT04_01810 [Planctomycetota bacterium]
MRMFALLIALIFFTTAHSADDLPPTLMTIRGKLIMSEDFDKPLPPPEGSTAHFASGFKGWRFNVVKRGGHWDVVDGTFKGSELSEAKHPATASFGFDFKNVVIQCDICLHDVTLAAKDFDGGRKTRYFNVRTCDAKDYVCSIVLNPAGMKIQKDDNDHAGPDKPVPLGKYDMPLKLGEWYTVVFEILGDEMVGTLNGLSLTGTHPLIGTDKHSVMFVSGVDGSVRHLKIWDAQPNPEWEKNKALLLAAQKSGEKK